MSSICAKQWKEELPEFREKTAAFYSGEMNKGAYKGFSGFYGSYAQKDGKASMLRLRMPAGRVSKEHLAFVAEMIRKYHLTKVHFTTCQTIQLHNLGPEIVADVMEDALDAGIVTIGGGGDYPRNVMCSPLSGVETGEYFDVLPWAMEAGRYLLQFIKAEKMPRKLKVGFSNSPRNLTHATYRDLGFAAREDGCFDVYSAGGLGNHARMGVKIAEAVKPEKILSYIKAMWLTFRAYGNYENRGKARTRYMQEALGGPDQYRETFLQKLKEVEASGENLDIFPETAEVTKAGAGHHEETFRVRRQKKPGLYTVVWHPLGGQPRMDSLTALAEAVKDMEAVELRLAPDETAYIINLTADEVDKVLEAAPDSAASLFETSVSCIGASICQVGLRDSQELLAACVQAVRQAGIEDGALPQIHISGCPSSCGTHQTGAIGFRGAGRMIDGKSQPGFMVYVHGREEQGQEAFGRELGVMLTERIPEFLTALGKAVQETGMDYEAWNRKNPQALERLAADYL
ncbi:MAG: nitrite/sulfite reductase [Lachnospiraceae bacterium]|nr:nitrite/sulfite reductase [Lachnospiraceae bacterium]